MKEIVINDDNLLSSEIDSKSTKSRAILISDNKILVANYGGVYLFPGGSVDVGEDCDKAIARELEEETGVKYDYKDLKKICLLRYYQRDYPTRDNEKINRLVSTHYFLGKYKGIDLNKVQRTEKEIKDDFRLELLKPDEMIQYLCSNNSNNERKEYFDRELIEMLKNIDKTDIESLKDENSNERE